MHGNRLPRRQHGKGGSWEDVVATWLFCCCYLLTHVDLGEAEGAEVRVGAFHRRLDRLSEQFVHELTDKRPHLFHRLGEDRSIHFSSNYTAQEEPFHPSQGGHETTSDCKQKKPIFEQILMSYSENGDRSNKSWFWFGDVTDSGGTWPFKDQTYGAFIIMQYHLLHYVTLYHSYRYILRYKLRSHNMGGLSCLALPVLFFFFLNTSLISMVKMCFNVHILKWRLPEIQAKWCISSDNAGIVHIVPCLFCDISSDILLL